MDAPGLTAIPQVLARRTPWLFSKNPRIRAIRAALMNIALADVPVVLRGETGVGKEVLARQIHELSPRARKPFVKINCAAVPRELLESELFGYEAGAFTGASRSTPGKFEAANGGSVLLDEIGDMDYKLQAKLLHVLQDGEFQRLGGRQTLRVDVRIMAATHCDLERAMQEKKFREDLFYRLNVISIELPPLRERRDEILPLAEHFLRKHSVPGFRLPPISASLREALLGYSWPGNIRELENTMRKLLVFGSADQIAEEIRLKANRLRTTSAAQHATSFATIGFPDVGAASRKAEAEIITAALERTHWNRKKAAALLKIDYKALLYKIKRLGLEQAADQVLPAEEPDAMPPGDPLPN